MSDKKIIAVFGATGSAGGSVAKYLLDDGTFAVRAVTRNAESPAAQALKARGAEVVVADLDKPETIPPVLKGVYGVSALTDFWTLFPKIGDPAKTRDLEIEQGKALVDGAKAAGVKHLIFFTLPAGGGVPHFESKQLIGEYLEKSGVPHTYFYNAFYYENFVGQFDSTYSLLKSGENGSIIVDLPIPDDAYLPAYSVDQSGGWILEIFKNPSEYIGKDVHAVGEHISPNGFAAVLSKALGKEVKAKPVSREEFYLLGKGNVFEVELWLNMKYFYELSQPPNSFFDEAWSKKVFSGSHTFGEFVQHNERFKSFAAKHK